MSRDTVSGHDHILVLKLVADGDKFVNELSARGYAVHGVSPHEFCFSNRELLRSAILSPEKYSGLILTSQRATDAIKNCFTSKDDLQEWQQDALLQWQLLPVFVVGKATEGTAIKTGFKTMGSDAGNAKALIPIIKEWFGSTIPEKPLLFPSADIRKETLPEGLKSLGIPLQEIIAYCTRPNPELEENLQTLIKLNVCYNVDLINF
jgi:uroporphyrinogen-III synthase